MAIRNTYSPHARLPSEGPTHTAIKTRVGIRERWRQHRAERERRILVEGLRRAAKRTDARRWQVLLRNRAAAVRTDLLEIAATLERAEEPDANCVAELKKLLTDGCESPLYNPDVHISELRATLHYVRSGLLRPGLEQTKGSASRSASSG